MRFTTALGKSLRDGVLDLLRAGAGVFDGGVAALGAFRRRDGLVAADVADDAVRGAVKGERDGAIRALADVAALLRRCSEVEKPRRLRKRIVCSLFVERGR